MNEKQRKPPEYPEPPKGSEVEKIISILDDPKGRSLTANERKILDDWHDKNGMGIF